MSYFISEISKASHLVSTSISNQDISCLCDGLCDGVEGMANIAGYSVQLLECARLRLRLSEERRGRGERMCAPMGHDITHDITIATLQLILH